jgi:hypothetical protein
MTVLLSSFYQDLPRNSPARQLKTTTTSSLSPPISQTERRATISELGAWRQLKRFGADRTARVVRHQRPEPRPHVTPSTANATTWCVVSIDARP